MNNTAITPTEHYPSLAKALGLPDLYFKREDLHPLGSHKGRSIPFMIDHYRTKGDHRFAISSSGNAALAAALHVNRLNDEIRNLKQSGDPRQIELDIFVGQHIATRKLEKLKNLENADIRILKKERPIQALTLAVEDGMRSLRQSTDDIALEGYKSLAEELAAIGNIAAVFIGTSSGTTAQALANHFKDEKSTAQIHIVQTSSCHPLTDDFENYDGPDEKSMADAIVDITANRKPTLIPLVKETGGYGWVVTNEGIEMAQEMTEKHTGLRISVNSALSVAGTMQAVYRDFEFNGAVVCMICGE